MRNNYWVVAFLIGCGSGFLSGRGYWLGQRREAYREGYAHGSVCGKTDRASEWQLKCLARLKELTVKAHETGMQQIDTEYDIAILPTNLKL